MSDFELVAFNPVTQDEYGVLRVGESRVTLAVIVARHQQGDTPEQIQDSFPTVDLASVYGAIAYYIHSQTMLDEEFAHQEKVTYERHQEWLKTHPPTVTKEILAARYRARQDAESE